MSGSWMCTHGVCFCHYWECRAVCVVVMAALFSMRWHFTQHLFRGSYISFVASFIQQTSFFAESHPEAFLLWQMWPNTEQWNKSSTVWRCLIQSSLKPESQHNHPFISASGSVVCVGVALSVCEDWVGVGCRWALPFRCWSTLTDGLTVYYNAKKCTKLCLLLVMYHDFILCLWCLLLIHACSCFFSPGKQKMGWHRLSKTAEKLELLQFNIDTVYCTPCSRHFPYYWNQCFLFFCCFSFHCGPSQFRSAK